MEKLYFMNIDGKTMDKMRFPSLFLLLDKHIVHIIFIKCYFLQKLGILPL